MNEAVRTPAAKRTLPDAAVLGVAAAAGAALEEGRFSRTGLPPALSCWASPSPLLGPVVSWSDSEDVGGVCAGAAEEVDAAMACAAGNEALV